MSKVRGVTQRRHVVTIGAVCLIGLVSGLVGLTAPVWSGQAGAAATAHTTIGSGGPSVSANPTADLGPNQWSYVSLSGFPTDDTVTVSYCSDAAGTDLSDEPCDLAATSAVVIFADGTAATSIEVSEVDPSGTPIPGDNGANFFCTNDARCSIDVTDPTLSGSATKTAANTAVIPVTFATPAAACPAATTVATASEYGLAQELLSDSAALACSASAPATAFNTELDAVPAVQALQSGGDQIAFVDNPNDPAVQAALGSEASHVAYIPVALTANVLGFKATESHNSTNFPDNAFALTPTMVAGFAANVSSYQQQAQPPPDPAPGCTPTRTVNCSVVTELNPAQGGFGLPSAYGALVRAGSSGTTYNLEQWLCAVTTNTPVPLPGGSTVTEQETPGQTLADGFGSAAASCPASDQFPALSTGGGNWFSEVSPAQQANKLESGLANQTAPSAFFAPMVWSEAFYNGLNDAGLENGAGAIVTPTAASIDAALADATTDPNGTLAYDFDDTTTSGAYPMPDVVYAVVPTLAMPAATAAAERSLLGALLTESSPTATTALPGGFVPLTSALYAQGEAALTAALPAASPPPQGSQPGASSQRPFAGGALGAAGDLGGGLGFLGLSPLDAALFQSVASAAGAGHGKTGEALVIPTPLKMQLSAHDMAWVVPWFSGALIVAAILGPLLLTGLRVYRRRTGLTEPVDEAAGDAPPDPDEVPEGTPSEHASMVEA
jgi:hypothetical protein